MLRIVDLALLMTVVVRTVPAATMAPSADGSVGGLLVAGAVLVGIGRFKIRKR